MLWQISSLVQDLRELWELSCGTKPVLYSHCNVNWVLAVVVPNLACCLWGMQVSITERLFLTSLLVFMSLLREIKPLWSVFSNSNILTHSTPDKTTMKGRNVFKCFSVQAKHGESVEWRVVAAVLFSCLWDYRVGSGGGAASSRETCGHHGLCAGMETTWPHSRCSNTACH